LSLILHKVSDGLYGSAHPTAEGMARFARQKDE
jgi:hypothetical protein